MNTVRLCALFVSCQIVLAISSPAVLHAQNQEKIDLEAISKIRYEGFHNSKIMQLATGLFEEIGARLTG